MRMRRIVIAAVLAALGAGGVTAAPAQAADPAGPMLLVPAVRSIDSGTPTWVQTSWGTTLDICDVQITAHVVRATIVYPDNTATYTSFSRDNSLATGATDYASFQVTVWVAHTQLKAIHLTINYKVKSHGYCAGPVQSRMFYATLPVQHRRVRPPVGA